MIQLRRRSLIAAVSFAVLVGLGIFVNPLFLLAAGASVCGLVHVFIGHSSGATHRHEQVLEEKEKGISVNDS